jgi:predicted AAA+ superfamily ATPase
MKIIDIVKLSDEIIHSKGRIEGWDSLRGIFEGRKESDPNYVFRTTYLTDEIKNLLKAIEEKLGGKRATGFFEILGGYGTGKSRILVLLWHLFKNNELAIEWAKRHGIDLNLPKDVKLLAFNLNFIK